MNAVTVIETKPKLIEANKLQYGQWAFIRDESSKHNGHLVLRTIDRIVSMNCIESWREDCCLQVEPLLVGTTVAIVIGEGKKFIV